jgi:outer membrane protein assembly factor BamB
VRGVKTSLLFSLSLSLLAACGSSDDGGDADGGGGGTDGAPEADAAGPPDEPVLLYPAILQVEFAPAVAADGTIVVHGKRSIYTPDELGTVLAIDPSGELLWSGTTDPGAVPAPPATIHDGVVIAPATVSGEELGGRVYRFELDGGAPVDPLELVGPITDGVAIAAGGAIVAPATPLMSVGGADDWTYDMTGGGKTGSNAAIAPDGTIYVAGRGVTEHNLHAVGPDGEGAWMRDLGAAVIDPIAVDDDGRAYVVNTDGELFVYEPSGDLAWSFQLDSYSSGGGPILGHDGVVFVGTGGNTPGDYDGEYMYAVRQAEGTAGEILWRKLVGLSWVTHTPALSEGGTLYVSDFCRTLAAVRASDGAPMWEYQIPEVEGDQCAGWSAPVIAGDGTVYAWNEGLAGAEGVGAGLYRFPGDGTGPAATPWPQEGADAAHTGRAQTGPE